MVSLKRRRESQRRAILPSPLDDLSTKNSPREGIRDGGAQRAESLVTVGWHYGPNLNIWSVHKYAVDDICLLGYKQGDAAMEVVRRMSSKPRREQGSQ